MTVGGRRSAYLGLGLLSLALAVPGLLAREQDKPRKVRASIVVILASETDSSIDPKLECIAREVRKTHSKLQGFKMVNFACQSLTVGVPEQFELVEEHQASVTVLNSGDKEGRVQLKVRPPRMGNITYSTPCGKFLTIVTPLQTKAGESILLAVRVQPCGGK